MTALAMTSTVNRVANPSAVRQTRKARMRVLKGLKGACSPVRALSKRRCDGQFAEENLNER
jgi:hypothetical protein